MNNLSVYRSASRATRWLLLVSVSAVLACGDGPTAPRVACDGPISVRVGTGTNPTFNWIPGCGVTRIDVIAPPGNNTGGTIWWLRSDTRLIGSGVRYGDSPSGTKTMLPAIPVTHGTQYAVVFTGTSGQPPVAIISWTP